MFCLTCAMLLVGVWAVSNTSIEIGGTISFSATNVHAKVSGVITGSTTGTNPTTLEYGDGKTQTTEALNSWKQNLAFDENGTEIEYTITVQNLSTERSLFVTITDTYREVTNLTKTTSFTSGTEVEVAKNTTQTFTITFTVGTTDISLDGSYGYNMYLRDESYIEPTVLDENKKVNGITFALDDSTMTASITGYDNSCNDDLFIPGYVSYDGKTYNLEKISCKYSSYSPEWDPEATANVYSSYFYSATNITIGEGVKVIESYAFCSYDDNDGGAFSESNYESITLPKSIEQIGGDSFSCDYYGGGNIEKFNYSGNIKDWMNISFGNEYSNPAAMTGDYSSILGNTTELTIDKATKIGSGVFYDCKTLTSLTIGDQVTSIGASAFSGCSSLTNMNYLGTIKDWMSITFGNKYSNPTYYTKSLVINGEEVTAITAEDLEDVTSIGASAFSGCSGLTSIEISTGVTSIGASAFSGCSGLTSIEIPTGVTSIGASAFMDCTGLTSIVIPNGVTSIALSVFSGCTGLTSVTIPDSVTSISTQAFMDCTGLTSIDIPNSVTSIVFNAFNGCTGLTNVIIPDSVKSIGMRAFYNCTSLTSVTIGSGVKTIDYSAFNKCSALATVVIDSATVASGITSKTVYGNLINYATKVYVKEGLWVGSYLSNTANFTVGTSDKTGYVMYTKV